MTNIKKTVLLCIAIMMIILVVGCTPRSSTVGEDQILDLYNEAIIDAMVAEEGEIFPLVSLVEEDDLTTWNDEGEVLLLTWHRYPDSYIAGEEMTLQYGDVWTFTDLEIVEWYKDNGKEGMDYELRFEQLIGLPPSDEKTHFTALWVSPEDVVRPAYQPDITEGTMDYTYTDDISDTHRSWLDDNTISSYFEEEKYPWTRLGYTYDWSGGDSEYGLTEFLIQMNAEVEVEFTKTTEEFIAYMEDLVG